MLLCIPRAFLCPPQFVSYIYKPGDWTVAMAEGPLQLYIPWISFDPCKWSPSSLKAPVRVVTGTAPGPSSTAGWTVTAEPNVMVIDIDASAAGFSSDDSVVFLSSLAGAARHWAFKGAACQGLVTRWGFRLRVQHDTSCDDFLALNMVVHWVGIEMAT